MLDYDEFVDFIEDNVDFAADRAIHKLLEVGYTELCVRLGHAQQRMPWALDLLARTGAIHMSEGAIEFLLTNGYAGLLLGEEPCYCNDGDVGASAEQKNTEQNDFVFSDILESYDDYLNTLDGTPKSTNRKQHQSSKSGSSPDTHRKSVSQISPAVILRTLSPEQQLDVLMFQMTDVGDGEVDVVQTMHMEQVFNY